MLHFLKNLFGQFQQQTTGRKAKKPGAQAAPDSFEHLYHLSLDDSVLLFPDKFYDFCEFVEALMSKPDIVAVRWTLSLVHESTDICDLFASADLFGLGPGIFPKDKIPLKPHHPDCHCYLEELSAQALPAGALEQAQLQTEQGHYYLSRLPEASQKAILGAAWKDWKQGTPWAQCLWEQYGVPKKITAAALSEHMSPIIQKLQAVSLGARYHFVDILRYRTFPNPLQDAREMNFFETRQKEIDFEKTANELLAAGLIKRVTDVEPVLALQSKETLSDYMVNPKKQPKNYWSKQQYVQFLLENYPDAAQFVVRNSLVVDLADEVKPLENTLREYLVSISA